eukprot:Skav212264  [mRNA]  locus=scaffold732:76707:77686:- [translate_table: standard]
MQRLRLQSSTLVPALTCSLAAAYIARRLHLKSRQGGTAEVDSFQRTSSGASDATDADFAALKSRTTSAESDCTVPPINGMQLVHLMMVEPWKDW